MSPQNEPADWRDLPLRFTWLLVLLILSGVASLAARSFPLSSKLHFSSLEDEFSWRVSRDDSCRLNLNSGRIKHSRTSLAEAAINQRGERVVVEHRLNPRSKEVCTYSKDGEVLLRTIPLDRSTDNFQPWVLDGRYILWESPNQFIAIDLEDVDPLPFRLDVSSESELVYYTNPILRVAKIDGDYVAQLIAVEDHSIAIRNEWFMSANLRQQPMRAVLDIYSLNKDDTFIEKYSSIDGSFFSRFPMPTVPLGSGLLQPYWRLLGGVVCAHSNDLQLGFVYDFVHQRTSFTPSDSPVLPLTTWPRSKYTYFRHLRFGERNLLNVYNLEEGKVESNLQIRASFESAYELSDGRLVLTGWSEGITFQVLDPESGTVVRISPLRWISYTIPVLLIGFAASAYFLLLRSGRSSKLDCISVVLFASLALAFLGLRLDKYSYLRDLLVAYEAQVYFSLSTSIMVASGFWLFLAKTSYPRRIIPLLLSTGGIVTSTYLLVSKEGFELTVGLFTAIFIGLSLLAVPIILGRYFGLSIVTEKGFAGGQSGRRFAYGIKDILALTFCVALVCIAVKMLLHLEETRSTGWELCDYSVPLSIVCALGFSACLSRKKWFFQIGFSITLLGTLAWIIHDCFLFYSGCSPITLVSGLLDPNELTRKVTEGRSIASVLRSGVSSLASVFMIAIVLRNHGWRLAFLPKTQAT